MRMPFRTARAPSARPCAFAAAAAAVLAASLTAQSAASLQAQQLPPPEPPRPMPGHDQGPTLSLTTTEVLVPTLVEKPNGTILYGLKASDFILEDNGVPQKIRVQEEMDTAPVALVGFDSTQHLIQDFTGSGDEVNDELKNLQPGDGGAAILDAVSYAVNLLQSQPKSYRRVLLLISEERDHGSRHARPQTIIRQIGESDVLVLSVAFSPARAEFGHDVMDPNVDDRTMNMVSGLMAMVKAFRKNVTREIAVMSGGEYTTFTGDKKFEARIVDAAKHARNRYLITFSPSNPEPGLHTIRVRTAEDYGARIVARANYWVGPEAQ